MTERPSAHSLALLAGVVLAGHLSLAPRVADLDSFYHVGHAAAYAEGSIFDTSLPWATQSVIADYGADLWWGFHVALVPFAAFGDVATGIRVAGLVLSLVLAGTVVWILRRHGIAGAGWWAALFLIAVPNVFYRYLMVRPHLLSLPAALLLLSVLVRGRWWHVALLTAAISWLHLGLFWMAPGVFLAYALVSGARRAVSPDAGRSGAGVPLAAGAAAVLAGTTAGWLLRPEALEAALLVNVQILRLLAAKATEQPLLFAAELSALGTVELVRTSWGLLLAWGIAAGAATAAAVRGRLGALPDGERTLLGSTLLISCAFLTITLVSARRAQVEWAAFGFLAVPFVWQYLVPAGRRRVVLATAAALLAVHVPWSAYRHTLNLRNVAFPGDALAETARWLEANTARDDVIFHARWDNFGPLFAHNRHNRYLGGMDPIFQFAHDPRLYWEHFWLSSDIHDEWTCDAFPCPSGVATDTYDVIADHFGARWVLVEPARNPRLSLFLLNDARFELALETAHEAVFRLVDRDSGAGG